MAKLEIRVTGLDQLRPAGASGGADISRQLRGQAQLADRVTRSLTRSVDTLVLQIGDLGKTIEQALSVGFARGAAAGADSIDGVNDSVRRTLRRTSRIIENSFEDVGDTLREEIEDASDDIERDQKRTASRVRAIWSRASQGIGSALRGAGGGIGSGLGSFGSGLGGAFSSLTGGGFSLSGLLGGVGGAAGSLTNGLGGGLANLTRGLGSGISGGLNLIPGVGPLLSGLSSGVTSAIAGGIQAAGSIGAGVLQAAGDLASNIVGKITSVIQVGLVAGIVLAVSSAAKASDFQRLESQFNRLTETIGTNGTAALTAFRTATRGTVADVNLLAQANEAIISGAVASQAEFSKLANGAVRLGRALNIDSADAVDGLTKAFAEQSVEGLKAFGVVLNIEGAYQRFAEATGRTASAQLSATERAKVFRDEALGGIDRALAKLGPAQADYTETVEQLGAAFGNLQVRIGNAFLPILTQITPQLTRITEGIAAWLSENQVQIADRLSAALSAVPDILSNIAGFIEGNSLGGFFDSAAQALNIFIRAAGAGLDGLLSRIGQEIIALGTLLEGEFTLAMRNVVNNTPFLRYIIDDDITPVIQGNNRAAVGAARNAGRLAQEEGFTRAASELARLADIFQVQQRQPQSSGSEISFAPRPSPVSGFGIGFGVGTTDPAEVADIAARLAAVTANLQLLGIAVEDLPDATKELLNQIASSVERTAAVRGEADAFIASALSRSTQEALASERERLDQIRTESSERERLNREIESQIREIKDGFRETTARLTESFARAREQIEAEDQNQRQQATARRDSALSSRFNQLAGAGGGLEGISLPLNVFKAIEDVRRQDSKRVFDQLRLATQGLSSSDLSANNGELLRSVLTAQAERDTGATRTLTAELAAISETTRAALATTTEEFRTATEAAGESFVTAMNAAVSALEDGVFTFERLTLENQIIAERIAALEKKLEAISRIERLARS